MKKSIEAYAKINLYLKVCSRMANGYHEIESIMQTVSLSDTVTLELNDKVSENSADNEIIITSDDASLPTDKSNIAYKCAKKYFSRTKIRGKIVQIHIEKRIPKSGGLAGGSTDGAAVLKLLNDMCGSHLSIAELCLVGAEVGADIPFCIVGGCCICRGIGDKLEKLEIPVPEYRVLIAESSEGVSTPEAYALVDNLNTKKTEETNDKSFGEVMLSLKNGEIPRTMYNSFENVILPIRHEAAQIKRGIISCGADIAMMSGSGPSVFGLFCDVEKLNAAQKHLRELGVRSHICEFVL